MKIYPVVSNAIKIELGDGTTFELTEDSKGMLHICAIGGYVAVKRLNVETISWDTAFVELSVTIAHEEELK